MLSLAIKELLAPSQLENIDDTPCYAAIYGQSVVKGSKTLPVHSPIDGSCIASSQLASEQQLRQQIEQAKSAFTQWQCIPAPRRGELVRLLGNQCREHKDTLASIITIECGKTLQESLGEVQEVIDICDFAVGLSRQLYGLSIVSERAEHRLMEQWHPLGVIGIITAFNFPMAVWAWNAALALVCGNTLVWKPSEKAPLCALACQHMLNRALTEFGNDAPAQLSCVVNGEAGIGQSMCENPDIALLSATGSVPMGKQVAKTVAARLGRSLLELGGNNAMIVSAQANMDLALRAIVFSAVGTSGQRCTSLRRLIVHHSVKQTLLTSLAKAFDSVSVGDPRQADRLMGPLIDQRAFQQMGDAINRAVKSGAQLICGGQQVTQDVPKGGFYVRPCLVEIDHNKPAQMALIRQETFAPILYVLEYDTLETAIELHNDVPQGLSSAIFTDNIHEAELFMSTKGSDCGLANVNIGTSGAEIGGAFGGEKDTGGGRESGSDAWKNYMRRATNTINYGRDLPLAQGISFDF